MCLPIYGGDDAKEVKMLLTDQIYHKLFEEILKGVFVPGERFLTEQETMERFGASRITVRRAFARLEENNIILRRRKLGTVVNNTFAAAKGELRTIGALLPTSDPFARSFLESLCKEAAEQDVITVLEPVDSGSGQNEAVIRLASHGVRDIVVWGMDRSVDSSLFLRLRILGVNLVFFDRINPGDIADYVCLDNESAVKTLLDQAQKQGIKHLFFADTAWLDVDTNKERCRFFQKECVKRNISGGLELPAEFPPNSGILAVNVATALALLDRNVPLFVIDALPENCRGAGVCIKQPMEKMAAACFHSLREQRRLGSRWRAKEFRISGELVL